MKFKAEVVLHQQLSPEGVKTGPESQTTVYLGVCGNLAVRIYTTDESETTLKRWP